MTKQITMTEIQNLKRYEDLEEVYILNCLGHWKFKFVIYLSFGAWILFIYYNA